MLGRLLQAEVQQRDEERVLVGRGEAPLRQQAENPLGQGDGISRGLESRHPGHPKTESTRLFISWFSLSQSRGPDFEVTEKDMG
ncbi:hypothetical protein [Archangium sp.]|uniref:hypothetical protein n=1 Tax=Archangium sp. TaxID=1872627 RepID=UPI002ED925C5